MITSALKHEEIRKEPNVLMNSSFDELTQETSTDPEEPKRIYQQNESVRRLSQNRRQQQQQQQPEQRDQVQYNREQKGQIKYTKGGSSVETDSSGIYSAATAENNRMANIVRKISRMNLDAMDQLDTRSVCSMRSVGSIRSAAMSASRLANRKAPEEDAQSINVLASGLGKNNCCFSKIIQWVLALLPRLITCFSNFF